MGAGCVFKHGNAGIRKAERKGIIVVHSRLTVSDIVPPDARRPALVSDWLNPAKSPILLLALTKTINPAVIQEYSPIH
nr:hypothetical protein [Brenneria rubrifaciens]